MVVEQVRAGFEQISRIGLTRGLAIAAIAGFSADMAATAIADPFSAGESGLAPLVVPTADEAATVEQCETAALSSPNSLTGNYIGGFVLNNNNYEVRSSNRTLPKGCNGKLVVKLFQQKQEEGIGLHPTLEWTRYGFRPDHTTVRGGLKTVVMRAARLCWPISIGGGGDFDKKHRTKARPAMTKTYTPAGGPSVSKTFTGSAATVCK